MKIQINTDHNIKGPEAMAEQTKATVESTLGHLADHNHILERLKGH